MPPWLQWIIGVGAAVTAVWTVWIRALKPIAQLVVLHNRLLPVLTALLAEFEKSPDAFSVLADMAKQFKADSGSSLRDAVDRIQRSADDAKAAADNLKSGVAAQRQLATIDRDHVSQLMILLDRVAVMQRSATGERKDILDAIAGETKPSGV